LLLWVYNYYHADDIDFTTYNDSFVVELYDGRLFGSNKIGINQCGPIQAYSDSL